MSSRFIQYKIHSRSLLMSGQNVENYAEQKPCVCAHLTGNTWQPDNSFTLIENNFRFLT